MGTNPITYPIDDLIEIVTVDGNRAPGDRKIYRHYKKRSFFHAPLLKELYLWIQLKAKVENNNYRPPAEGKERLRRFLNDAIDGKPWNEVKPKYDENNKMKD